MEFLLCLCSHMCWESLELKMWTCFFETTTRFSLIFAPILCKLRIGWWLFPIGITMRSLLRLKTLFISNFKRIGKPSLPPLFSQLAPRFYGPYEILESIGLIVYHLALLPNYRIHNVFNVSLLWKHLKPMPLVSPQLPPTNY